MWAMTAWPMWMSSDSRYRLHKSDQDDAEEDNQAIKCSRHHASYLASADGDDTGLLIGELSVSPVIAGQDRHLPRLSWSHDGYVVIQHGKVRNPRLLVIS